MSLLLHPRNFSDIKIRFWKFSHIKRVLFLDPLLIPVTDCNDTDILMSVSWY